MTIVIVHASCLVCIAPPHSGRSLQNTKDGNHSAKKLEAQEKKRSHNVERNLLGPSNLIQLPMHAQGVLFVGSSLVMTMTMR